MAPRPARITKAEAIESRRTPDNNRFRSVVVLYRQKAFGKLADTTKVQWAPWLDRIEEHCGRRQL